MARMRESMARLTPRFSANRVVREYTERHYLPAAAGYRARAAEKGALGAGVLAWQRNLAAHWSEARFGAVAVQTRDDHHQFVVQLSLGGLDPEAVRVELYADPTDGGEPARHVLARDRTLAAPDAYEYRGRVPASRPASDYTPRLVPHHPAALVPLEAPQILWPR